MNFHLLSWHWSDWLLAVAFECFEGIDHDQGLYKWQKLEKDFFNNISYSHALLWEIQLITENSSTIKRSLDKYGEVLKLAEACTLWPYRGHSPSSETHIFHLDKDISLSPSFISVFGNCPNSKYKLWAINASFAIIINGEVGKSKFIANYFSECLHFFIIPCFEVYVVSRMLKVLGALPCCHCGHCWNPLKESPIKVILCAG